MSAVRKGGYLIRIQTRTGPRILGPYPTEAEAIAVRRDALQQRRKGRL